MAVKWKLIGTQLDIEPHVLDLIAFNHATDGAIMQCTEVIKTWQKKMRPPYTWATLIRVLTKESIGEYALAQELSRKILEEKDTY